MLASSEREKFKFEAYADSKFEENNLISDDLFLQPKYNYINEIERVTLKIDVSHTEHSHLIGRGGQNVKAMMLDSQCHIHFPDSNRTNMLEKSNQVSISGRPADVEKARKQIRQMLPLVYYFKIPCTSPHIITSYRASSIIQHIESKWPVEISYRHQYLHHLRDPLIKLSENFTSSPIIIASVRGLSAFAQSVIEATQFLIKYHFSNASDQISVWMTVEIEQKHQGFVINQVAPKKIEDFIFEATGASTRFPLSSQIENQKAMFLDVNRLSSSSLIQNHPEQALYGLMDSLGRPEDRTLVKITGSVASVYLARQIIMNLMPVMLISEVTNEECALLERLDCSSLKNSCDVAVSFRTKYRPPQKQSIVIKSSEENVRSLFYVLGHLTAITRRRDIEWLLAQSIDFFASFVTIGYLLVGHNEYPFLFWQGKLNLWRSRNHNLGRSMFRFQARQPDNIPNFGNRSNTQPEEYHSFEDLYFGQNAVAEDKENQFNVREYFQSIDSPNDYGCKIPGDTTLEIINETEEICLRTSEPTSTVKNVETNQSPNLRERLRNLTINSSNESLRNCSISTVQTRDLNYPYGSFMSQKHRNGDIDTNSQESVNHISKISEKRTFYFDPMGNFPQISPNTYPQSLHLSPPDLGFVKDYNSDISETSECYSTWQFQTESFAKNNSYVRKIWENVKPTATKNDNFLSPNDEDLCF